MSRQRRFQYWFGAVAGTICALLTFASVAQGADRRDFTEEFHQSYTISANGRVELDNINGAVHISSWDRNEVKVDARYRHPIEPEMTILGVCILSEASRERRREQQIETWQPSRRRRPSHELG